VFQSPKSFTGEHHTKERIMKKAAVVALAALSFSMPVRADSVTHSSAVSVISGLAIASTVAWAAHGGSQFVVTGVEVSGEVAKLALEGVGNSVRTVAEVSADVAGAASVGIGTSVRVVAESTGTALIAGGRLLAFIPNELGRSLLFHARQTSR
jgi:hypothetical protein